jgi:hypothetical protein
MSERKAHELAHPEAGIVATGLSALSPEIMGLGLIEASRRAGGGRHVLGDVTWIAVQHDVSPTRSISWNGA